MPAVRSRTHTGRPFGLDRFLSKVERILGRHLRALPVARPRKVTEEGENR